MEKKRLEEATRMAEATASFSIRQIIEKLFVATPENVESIKKELQDVLTKELSSVNSISLIIIGLQYTKVLGNNGTSSPNRASDGCNTARVIGMIILIDLAVGQPPFTFSKHVKTSLSIFGGFPDYGGGPQNYRISSG